jgi:hypothetical protein
MEVPPEALVEPASGHAVVQGGVSSVVRVASCGIHGKLLPESWPKSSSGEAEFSPRLRLTTGEVEFLPEAEFSPRLRPTTSAHVSSRVV